MVKLWRHSSLYVYLLLHILKYWNNCSIFWVFCISFRNLVTPVQNYLLFSLPPPPPFYFIFFFIPLLPFERSPPFCSFGFAFPLSGRYDFECLSLSLSLSPSERHSDNVHWPKWLIKNLSSYSFLCKHPSFKR